MKNSVVKHKLHPVVIFAGIFKKITTMTLFFIVYLALHQNYFDRISGGTQIFVILFTIVGIYRSYLYWRNFNYSVDKGNITIESGILFKKIEHIPSERILNVDTRTSLWHYIAGVVELRMNTAGGAEDKQSFRLRALSKEKAKQLLQDLGHFPEAEQVLWNNSKKLLVIYSFTSFKIGFIFAIISFFIFQMDMLKSVYYYNQFTLWLDTFTVEKRTIVLIMMLGGVSWLCSVLITAGINSNFSVLRSEDGSLKISKGLLNKRVQSISLNNIVEVRVVESLFCQPFGYCTVYLGCHSGDGEQGMSNLTLIPLMKRKKAAELMCCMLPGEFKDSLLPGKEKKNWHYQAKPAGWLGYIITKLILCMMLLPIIYGIENGLLLWSGVVLGVLLWGYVQFKDSRISIQGMSCTLCYRVFNKSTAIIHKRAIEQLSLTENPVQTLNQQCSFSLVVKTKLISRKIRLKNYEVFHGRYVMKWFES